MRVKIESWRDFRRGDKWLGLEIDNRHGREVHATGSGPGWYSKVILSEHQVDALIAAGNDFVERKPEKVEFEADEWEFLRGESVTGYDGITHHYSTVRFRQTIGPGFAYKVNELGKRVKVTVEEL